MAKQKSFYGGMLTAFGLVVTLLVLWMGSHLSAVMPILNANPSAKKYKAPSKASIAKAVTSLEQLYHLSKFLGLEAYSSKAIGSAGKALSLRDDKASKLQAKYYFLKSIEEAEKVALGDDGLLSSGPQMDPLFEAYLKYSFFLNDSGERVMAKRALKKAKRLAKKTKSKSARAKEVQLAIHKMNMKKI